jgi:hypothetical protein
MEIVMTDRPQTTTPLATNPELIALLSRARDVVEAMTPEQRGTMIAAQRRSYVIGEAGMGSDADEAAYRAALVAGDHSALVRLNAESMERMQMADRILKEHGL